MTWGLHTQHVRVLLRWDPVRERDGIQGGVNAKFPRTSVVNRFFRSFWLRGIDDFGSDLHRRVRVIELNARELLFVF